MHQNTPLSSGTINGQTFTIELVEPGNDLPNAVVIKWPVKPTITSPAAFDKLIADTMRVLSNAVVELVTVSSRRGPRNAAEALAKHAACTPSRPPTN